MDKGPWVAGGNTVDAYVESVDFTHDVRLRVDGDFRDYAQRREYAEWLAETLNAATRSIGG